MSAKQPESASGAPQHSGEEESVSRGEASPADTGLSPTGALGAGETLPGHNEGGSEEYATTGNATRLAELVSAVIAHMRQEAASAPRGPRLPEPLKPEPFDGDSTKLRAYLARVKLYLGAFEKAPDADKARVIASSLTGMALRQYMRLIEDRHPSTPTVREVLDMLERRFADQNEASDARYKFQHAQQLTNQPVLAFANYLEELADTPGCEDLRNEISMKERLFTGMHASLQHALLPCKRQLHTIEDVLEFAIDAERNLARTKGRTVPEDGASGSQEADPHNMEGEEDYSDPWAAEPPANMQQEVERLSAQIAAMQAGLGYGRGRGWRRQKPPRGTPLLPGKDGESYKVQCYQCNRWGHYQSQCPGQEEQETAEANAS